MDESLESERAKRETEKQAAAAGGAVAGRAAGGSPSRDSKRGSLSQGAASSSSIPTECAAFLARKVHLMAGGKRSPDRAWRSFFTVLAGHLLCYFKDRDGLSFYISIFDFYN